MRNRLSFLMLMMTVVCGCQKYAPGSQLSNPAYFRVFNSITNAATSNSLTSTQDQLNKTRLLCLLIDPQTDAGGKFTGAAQIGDMLVYRAVDAAAYESYPNDQIQRFSNLEYPGALRIPAAGNINGLDLSRWAQITPGRHRLVFMRRLRQSYGVNESFRDFSPVARDTVFRLALDTTVDLQAQKVYTLDVLSASTTDPGPLRLLVRQEALDTDVLGDTTKMYVNFYNYLESANAPDNLDIYYQWQYVVNTLDPLLSAPITGTPITYSRAAYLNDTSGFIKTTETFLTTVKGRFGTTPPAYSTIQMTPLDSFYYNAGPALGQYRLAFDRPRLLLNCYLPGQSVATGAKPYTTINCSEYNNYSALNTSPDFSSVSPGWISALYQTVIKDNVAHPFALVNSIFLASLYSAPNTIRANTVMSLQVSVQHPFGPGFIHP